MDDYRIITVDFDGCMCEDRWPEIGAPIEGTIRRLKEEQAAGSKLILWTCRTGEQLTAALAWSAEQGVTFDAVNDNLPEIAQRSGGDARKIFATEYWDDRAVRVSQKTEHMESEGHLFVYPSHPFEGFCVKCGTTVDWCKIRRGEATIPQCQREHADG